KPSASPAIASAWLSVAIRRSVISCGVSMRLISSSSAGPICEFSTIRVSCAPRKNDAVRDSRSFSSTKVSGTGPSCSVMVRPCLVPRMATRLVSLFIEQYRVLRARLDLQVERVCRVYPLDADVPLTRDDGIHAIVPERAIDARDEVRYDAACGF